MELVDCDGDGTYVLHGIQSVSGVAHVNRISKAESFWEYTDGKWVPYKVNYTTPLVVAVD